MEEFGGGLINVQEAQLKEKRERWVNMLSVIDGMSHSKATYFVNTHSNASCPSSLRTALTDPRQGSTEARRDSMAGSFGGSTREIALSRKIFGILTCTNGDAFPKDGEALATSNNTLSDDSEQNGV